MNYKFIIKDIQQLKYIIEIYMNQFKFSSDMITKEIFIQFFPFDYPYFILLSLNE